MKWILFILVIPIFTLGFERKQEQFLNTPSYFLLPAPFQIPGIGNGWILFGGINNIALDYLDVYAYGFSGDVQGEGIGFDDLHIFSQLFSLKGGVQNVRTASVLTFDDRGMGNSKNEFTYLNAKKIKQASAGAELTFWNRRVNFYYNYYTQTYDVQKMLNSDEEEIVEFQDKQRIGQSHVSASFLLDLTNDFQDPTMGFRMSLSQLRPQMDTQFSNSRYSVINQGYNLYLPIGKWSSFVLHYFKSDAYTDKKGTDDEDEIAAELNLKDCATYSGDAQSECEQAQEKLITRTRMQNLYGLSTTLGGKDRLRGYPTGRFSGSHTRFYGAEFRWNLDSSVVPFDIFLIRDTRSAFQIAFFYEAGTTGDDEEEMLEHFRDSKGAGLRVVAKSGYVFRLDYGMSDEGSEFTLLGSYPW